MADVYISSPQKHALASPLNMASPSKLLLRRLESRRIAHQKAGKLQKRLQEAYDRMMEAKASA